MFVFLLYASHLDTGHSDAFVDNLTSAIEDFARDLLDSKLGSLNSRKLPTYAIMRMEVPQQLHPTQLSIDTITFFDPPALDDAAGPGHPDRFTT